VQVALGGDPAWSDQVHGNAVWGQFAGPRSRLPQLRAFGRYIIGEHGIAELEHFAPDLNDSAETAALHAGDHFLQDEQRRFYEKLQLVQIPFPGLLFNGQKRLRTGSIHDRDVDVLIRLVDGLDHFCDIRFLAHIRVEGSRFPALLLDLRADLLGTIALGKIIDGNLGAPGAKFQRNRCAQTPRSARNQSRSAL
jgi:hypothetical protein